MRVDWSHTPETGISYHQATPNVEATRKKKKRTSKKYAEMRSLDGHKDDRLQLEDSRTKAPDRRLWKTVVNDLCPRRGEG